VSLLNPKWNNFIFITSSWQLCKFFYVLFSKLYFMFENTFLMTIKGLSTTFWARITTSRAGSHNQSVEFLFSISASRAFLRVDLENLQTLRNSSCLVSHCPFSLQSTSSPFIPLNALWFLSQMLPLSQGESKYFGSFGFSPVLTLAFKTLLSLHGIISYQGQTHTKYCPWSFKKDVFTQRVF
jgi:hypothetical protein